MCHSLGSHWLNKSLKSNYTCNVQLKSLNSSYTHYGLELALVEPITTEQNNGQLRSGTGPGRACYHIMEQQLAQRACCIPWWNGFGV